MAEAPCGRSRAGRLGRFGVALRADARAPPLRDTRHARRHVGVQAGGQKISTSSGIDEWLLAAAGQTVLPQAT
jgi:hypothetical protein